MSELKSWKQQLHNDLNVLDFTVSLPGSKREITFKPITTKTIKKLLSYENSKSSYVIENALDELINDSVITEDFSAEKLLIHDRIFLLFYIRIHSKGSGYEFKNVCKKCKSQYIQIINLDEFNIVKLPDEYDKEIKITDNISIHIDHVNRKEQKEVLKLIEDIEGMSELEKYGELAVGTYAQGIKAIMFNDEIDSDLSFADKLYFLENLPENKFNEIKEWFEKNSFGIDLSHEKVCKHCGHTEKVEIPLASFF